MDPGSLPWSHVPGAVVINRAPPALHLPDLPHLPRLPRGVGAFLPGTVLATVAAVLGAIGSVLQHEAAEAAAADTGDLCFKGMVRRPVWLVGQSSTIAGSALQVAALALAPVSIVQPLLACALGIALGVRSARTRCWPTGSELAGAALTAGA